jgi:hypothetical protein
MSPQGAAAASLFKGAGGRKRVVSFGSVATAGGSGDQGEIEDEGDDAGGPGPSSPGAAAAAMMLMGSPGGSSNGGAGAGELPGVTLRARWVTLRARGVPLGARWVTLRAR